MAGARKAMRSGPQRYPIEDIAVTVKAMSTAPMPTTPGMPELGSETGGRGAFGGSEAVAPNVRPGRARVLCRREVHGRHVRIRDRGEAHEIAAPVIPKNLASRSERSVDVGQSIAAQIDRRQRHPGEPRRRARDDGGRRGRARGKAPSLFPWATATLVEPALKVPSGEPGRAAVGNGGIHAAPRGPMMRLVSARRTSRKSTGRGPDSRLSDRAARVYLFPRA